MVGRGRTLRGLGAVVSWLRALLDRARALWAGFLLDRAAPRFLACLESEPREAFLELLLLVMGLTLLVDRRFRQNIARYNASYVFQSRDRSTLATLVFAGGRMKVQPGAITAPDIIVTFEDHAALARFLFNDRSDLIGSIVDNEISCVGNLNYLRRLAYMAKQLQLRFACAQTLSSQTLSRSKPIEIRSACHCGSMSRKYS